MMMTKEAKTGARRWRKADYPDTFRHNMAGGIIIMDLVRGMVDENAREYVVTGLARIQRISPGLIRIGKYSPRINCNLILFYEVWDYSVWRREVLSYDEQAISLIDALPISSEVRQMQGTH